MIKVSYLIPIICTHNKISDKLIHLTTGYTTCVVLSSIRCVMMPNIYVFFKTDVIYSGVCH